MGPICGFRVVNLRVGSKVAYPDNTIDISADDHIVIGLENGGGKSTLLAFIIHVFLPFADKFLLRLAQRRQSKKGEEKLIQHYIPGGKPTHVIVELQLPPFKGIVPAGTPTRVLVGACLYKDARARVDDKCDEFFWAARCVSEELTLAGLGIRTAEGRLLDEREWRSWLDQMHTARPDAEILIEGRKGNWENYLRDVLKVDVEFVRSWLLSMNEDEGAADHVFTYESSRAFLNSLIGAVANPELIADLKKSLASTGAEADQVQLDRRREQLLHRLVEHSGSLAERADRLSSIDEQRYKTIDGVLAVRSRLTGLISLAEITVTNAQQEEQAANSRLRDALGEYADAHAQDALAHLQVARLRLQEITAAISTEQKASATAKNRVDVAGVAAILADLRTSKGRIRDVEQMLTAKAHDAEPARRSAASAAQAWLARLDEQLVDLNQRLQNEADREATAESKEKTASERHVQVGERIGRLDEAHKGALAEAARIAQLLDAAIDRGDMVADQSAEEAQSEAAEEAEQLRAEAARGQSQVSEYQRDLDGLGDEVAELQGRISQAAADAKAARQARDEAKTATENLENLLETSELLDLPSIRLVDAAEIIGEMLTSVIESAKRRQLEAAVQEAASRRAAQALEDTQLLPPRADVTRLCAMAATSHLNARPGWSYLADLQDEVAEQFAAAHPALADGIIVNAPDDLDDVADLVRDAREVLDGPVVVGSPRAFEDDSDVGDVAVVLPGEAFWSRDSAAIQLDHRRQDHQAHQQAVATESTRYDAAFRLREQLAHWRQAIGPGRLAELEQALIDAMSLVEELEKQRTDLNNQRQQLIEERDRAANNAQHLATKAQSAQARADRLAYIIPEAKRRPQLMHQAAGLQEELREARRLLAQYFTEIEEARSERKVAQQAIQQLNKTIGELGGIRNDAAALCDVVVRDGDPIDAADATGDRTLLAELAKSRNERWLGLTSDPQLRAELEQERKVVRRLEKDLGACEESIRSYAQARVETHPSSTSSDFRQDAEDARAERELIARRLGRLEEQQATHSQTVKEAESEFQNLRRPVRLANIHITKELPVAENVLRTLRSARERARDNRQQATDRQAAAAQAVDETTRRRDLMSQTDQQLDTLIATLSSEGPLTRPIDIEDRAFDLNADAALLEASAQMRQLVHTLEKHDQSAVALMPHVKAIFDQLTGEVDQLRRVRTKAEQETEEKLQDLEIALRDVDDELIAGDRLVQTLRVLHRRELWTEAGRHHDAMSARLAAVAHSVAKFDKKVETTAQTAFAIVQHLLRDVRQTIRDSHLPSTPALGRWGGLPLLKLGGLDALTIDQRRTAIHTVLQEWFDPDHVGRRPAFDADETVWALVEAVIPRFTAKVLIPSDPLDPEHKPVEHLARETSGGEGVTVALILASLLAARRASTHGHRRTTLLLDNPLSKVTKPAFLRLVRDAAGSLGVQIVALTGIRDAGALTVFPGLIQLRVSRRETANVVAPANIDDDRLQELVRHGTLYVSPVERRAAEDRNGRNGWPVMSMAQVHLAEQMTFDGQDGERAARAASPSDSDQ
jgi:hypothetical protein